MEELRSGRLVEAVAPRDRASAGAPSRRSGLNVPPSSRLLLLIQFSGSYVRAVEEDA